MILHVLCNNAQQHALVFTIEMSGINRNYLSHVGKSFNLSTEGQEIIYEPMVSLFPMIELLEQTLYISNM